MTDQKRPYTYHHQRVLQIMPADGWWIVYADDDGSTMRSRAVGFALVEVWESESFTDEQPPDGIEVDRQVIPLVDEGSGGIEVEGAANFIGVYHNDEWAEKAAEIAEVAKRYVERQAAERKLRAKT